MTKTEILNIANEPSKHIHIVKIDGKDSIVYSSKFVELLELIPRMSIFDKDDLENGINEFLKSHTISEFLEIAKHCIERKEDTYIEVGEAFSDFLTE